MKEVDIVSKIVNREGGTSVPSSKGTQSIDLSDYLLKSIWDKVFEVRTDSQGTEYIFGKLPMVTQYGITMYSGDGVDIPSLASGLPFDGRTIWYNPDTQQIEVIGGTGGGSGEGVSNFWDLSGIPSWITNSKPKYTYSEIEGTPDLTKYALASQIPSLSGYATESWVNQQNYAIKATTLSGYGITDAYTKTNVDDLLKSYVTLGGTPQTITGEKNFTGGLKVNGSPIYYDTEKKYWKLEGDLLVTGGVTMYGSDSSFTPSTIMDAIAVDGTTISKSGGVLKVIGGTGGGVADSVAWANITGKPTWIGSSKPTYSYSEITGAISTTELQNYLTQNSYLNVTSGDNRYLKLSGGTISGASGNYTPLIVEAKSLPEVWINFKDTVGNAYIGSDKGQPAVYIEGDRNYLLLHSGNYYSYALPLSGGTMTGPIQVGSYTSFGVAGENFYLGSPSYPLLIRSNGDAKLNGNTIWHSGNDGSGSGLDADLLDGVQESGFCRHLDGVPITSHRGIGYGYEGQGWIENGPALSVGYSGDNYLMQLQAPADYTALHFRNRMNGTWGDWKTIAFTDSNVASATKLQTARTIWGQSFDGTGNVSGALSDVTGITFKNDYYGLVIDEFGNFSFKKPYSTTAADWSFKDSSGNKLMTINNSGNVGIGTTSPTSKLEVSGAVKANYYDVNTTRQTTLTNSYTLGCGMYGSSIQHSVSDGYTLPALMWSAKSPNGNSSQFSIMSYHPPGATGYLIIGVAKNGARAAFIEVQGDGVIQAGGDFLSSGGITMYSDQRKKTILNHVELSLKQIADAPLIEHYYNSDEKKTTHVGSIAQYWASMNDWFCKLDSEGYYTMEIQNCALASAISIARELDRYETKTDKDIKKLKKRIYELEEEVERLKAS